MPKIRNIIIFIVIAIAFILIYVFFIKTSPPQPSLVSSGAGTTLPNIDGSTTDTSTSNTNALITKDFLALFSNIKNIKLNDAIFSDPAFNNLHDSSIVLIPDGTEGRPNPFAQFGADAPVPSVPATGVPATGVPATGVPATGVPATGVLAPTAVPSGTGSKSGNVGTGAPGIPPGLPAIPAH